MYQMKQMLLWKTFLYSICTQFMSLPMCRVRCRGNLGSPLITCQLISNMTVINFTYISNVPFISVSGSYGPGGTVIGFNVINSTFIKLTNFFLNETCAILSTPSSLQNAYFYNIVTSFIPIYILTSEATLNNVTFEDITISDALVKAAFPPYQSNSIAIYNCQFINIVANNCSQNQGIIQADQYSCPSNCSFWELQLNI